MPPETLYHRLFGWHAPALRRAVLAVGIGAVAGLVLGRWFRWEVTAVTGWDAAAATYLATIWPIILRADHTRAEMLARREDEQRGAAAVLLIGASLGGLLGAAFALGAASGQHGQTRGLLIGAAILTVALSWLVINTVYTAPGPAGPGAGAQSPPFGIGRLQSALVVRPTGLNLIFPAVSGP